MSDKRPFCMLIIKEDSISVLGECPPELQDKAKKMGGSITENGLEFHSTEQEDVVELCGEYFYSIKVAKA
jgi:hypothetical protein